MKKWWKHKTEVTIPQEEDIKPYLWECSVKASGVVDYDKTARLVRTQNGKSYAIFKVEYIYPNGIDDLIDRENTNKVNEVIKALIHDFKIVDMSVVKNKLDKNIEEMSAILHEGLSEKRKRMILERLDVMRFYNEEKYVTTYMFIEQADIEMFVKLAPSVFHIERVKHEEVKSVLSTLNNDME